MDISTATISELVAPISLNWTIEDLLQWFAEDDDRLSDHTLRPPLRAIEEALTGTRWTLDLDAGLSSTRRTREPAVISLVRSIALCAAGRPALRALTIGELLLAQPTVAAAASSSVVATS